MAKAVEVEVPALTVQSKVKDIIKDKGLRSSGDLADGLNKKVQEMLDQAAVRAKANGRSTVRPDDL